MLPNFAFKVQVFMPLSSEHYSPSCKAILVIVCVKMFEFPFSVFQVTWSRISSLMLRIPITLPSKLIFKPVPYKVFILSGLLFRIIVRPYSFLILSLIQASGDSVSKFQRPHESYATLSSLELSMLEIALLGHWIGRMLIITKKSDCGHQDDTQLRLHLGYFLSDLQ